MVSRLSEVKKQYCIEGRNGRFPQGNEGNEIRKLTGKRSLTDDRIAERIRLIMKQARIQLGEFLVVQVEDGKILICSTSKSPVQVELNLTTWCWWTAGGSVRSIAGRNETGHRLPASSSGGR